MIASGCGFGYDGDEKDVVFRRRWFLDSLTIGQSCELDKMQTSQDMQQPGGLSEYRRGFTLIELLVVVAIIALLVSILVPSLGEAMRQAELTTCQTRVKAQLQALHMYATSEDGLLPCGPDFPLFPGGPATNSVGTNNIWIGPAQTYNAHGVLLEASLVVEEAMFCPGDDTSDPVEELAKITGRIADELAFCSYFYRQLDAREGTVTRLRLDNLGKNASGGPVSALIMDANSLLVIPDFVTRTNHATEKVSIGFADGSVEAVDNSDGIFITLTGGQAEMLTEARRVFTQADVLR